MRRNVDGLSVVACLSEISARLTDAAAIARAAVTCAESGSERDALWIALDLDERLHEATTLHGALILLGRMRRRSGMAEGNVRAERLLCRPTCAPMAAL